MNNDIPLISIAMTTYNGEKFLKQQIDSILNQTYKYFELIICDDKSNDRTIEIIETYIKDHECIKLFRNDIQLGIVKNFEKAISLTVAKYIALSDQDDIWVENKLEILMYEMKKLEQSADNVPLMVHSDLIMIDEENHIINKSFFKFRNYNLKKTKDLKHLISRCGAMGNTILMNADLKKNVLPFPDNLDVHDYWIALINELYGKRSTIPDPLVHYRIHQHNYSNSIEKFEKNISYNFSLPYTNLGRDKVLITLLKKSNISAEDTKIIEAFVTYLKFNTNRLTIIYNLIKYDFLKKGFLYRFKIFVMILLTKRHKIHKS